MGDEEFKEVTQRNRRLVAEATAASQRFRCALGSVLQLRVNYLLNRSEYLARLDYRPTAGASFLTRPAQNLLPG
jgi:hypothetical protein